MAIVRCGKCGAEITKGIPCPNCVRTDRPTKDDLKKK